MIAFMHRLEVSADQYVPQVAQELAEFFSGISPIAYFFGTA